MLTSMSIEHRSSPPPTTPLMVGFESVKNIMGSFHPYFDPNGDQRAMHTECSSTKPTLVRMSYVVVILESGR